MDPRPEGTQELFAGRFAILDKLGSGGFGTVYRAYDQRLRIEVALKVTNSTVSDPEVIGRFEREAHVIAKLNHENIVKVYDCGVHEGAPYYAMEFVAGDTLQKVMERSRVLPVRAAARIARDVALALHHAHLGGVLHRDVKPHNIIIQPREGTSGPSTRVPAKADDSVKSSHGVVSEYRTVLTDFGLAKDLAAVTKLSVTGEVMGTPQYMAPEMAGGDSHSVGPHTDVYSLGVVLYYLLSGALPFTGNTFPEILVSVMTEDPVALKRLSPHLPPDLCAIVAKSMERDIAHRYRSALALAEDLESFLQGEPVSAKPPPMTVKLRRWMRRHVAACASVASAVLVAVAVAGYFGLVAPWMRASEERRELETARTAFLGRRAEIERDAKAKLDALRAKPDAAGADAFAASFARYRLAGVFPRSEFAWRSEFERHVPFDIPLVSAHLAAAHSCERAGQRYDAMRQHLKAYFAWTDRAGGEDALAELAQFLLRTREFNHAAYFFGKLEKSQAGLAFALAGAGRYDEAVAAFRNASPGPAPGFRAEERLGALHDFEITADSLREAAELASIFAGRLDIIAWDRPDLHAVADLDADGRSEILVPFDGRIDVYGAASGAMRRTMSIPTDFPRQRPWLGDLDGDGRPELFECTQGFKAYRIRGERLELVAQAQGVASRALFAHDIDGDGVAEVLAVSAQAVSIYRKGAEGWASIAYLRYPGTDPIHVDARDIDGDGRPELLIATGTWASDTGFRLWVYRARDGKLHRDEGRPIGWLSGPLAHAVVDGRNVWHTTTGSWGGYARALDKRYATLGLAPELGLIRIPCDGGKPQAPELLWGRRITAWGHFASGFAPLVLRGRPGGLVWVEGAARLVMFDSLRYLSVPVPETAPVFADLDGDGDPEAVAMLAGRLCVSGLAGAPSMSAASVEARRTPASGRAADYQDALMSVSASTPANLFEDLIARFPEFEKELLLRVAEAHARSWEWAEAVKALERVQSTFFLGPAEAADVGERLKTAREALQVAETVRVDFRDPPVLLTNAPLKFRIDGGVLRAYGNSLSPGFLAIPVRSEERAGGISAQVVVNQLDYVTSFGIGVSDGIDRFGWDQDLMGAWRTWKRMAGVSTAGSGDTPGATGIAAASGGAGMLHNAAVRPGPEAIRVELEWVPGADAVRAHFGKAGTVTAPLGARMPAQDAFIVVTTGSQAYVGDDYWSEVEISKLALRGAASSRPFVPATVRDFFARGGGRFVAGDFAGALEDWRKTLSLLDGDLYGMKPDDAKAEIAFLSACALVRLGRRAEADEAMDEVLDTVERALGIFKRNFLGMKEDERDVFRDAFWRAFEGRPPQEPIDAISKRIRMLPNALLVWEILLFDEPRIQGLTAFLDDVERRFSYGGRTVAILRRAKAKLKRREGKRDEALRLLDEGLEAIRGRDVDEFNRFPLERELLKLRDSWQKE